MEDIDASLKWIDVNEKLPDYGKTVLVCNIEKQIVTTAHAVDHGHIGVGWWNYTGTGTSSIHIKPTHWMEFPKPPPIIEE